MYDVTVEREGQSWLVFIDGLAGLAQARNYTEAPNIARAYIAQLTGQERSAVKIGCVHVKGISDMLAQVEDMREQAKKSRAEATRLTVDIARRLHTQQIPLVEIGAILGLSHQRVSQLLAG